MKLDEFTAVIEKDEDGRYLAEIVELPGCITEAKTEEELPRKLKKAISEYLDTVDDLHIASKFVGIRKIKL